MYTVVYSRNRSEELRNAVRAIEEYNNSIEKMCAKCTNLETAFHAIYKDRQECHVYEIHSLYGPHYNEYGVDHVKEEDRDIVSALIMLLSSKIKQKRYPEMTPLRDDLQKKAEELKHTAEILDLAELIHESLPRNCGIKVESGSIYDWPKNEEIRGYVVEIDTPETTKGGEVRGGGTISERITGGKTRFFLTKEEKEMIFHDDLIDFSWIDGELVIWIRDLARITEKAQRVPFKPPMIETHEQIAPDLVVCEI